MRRILAAMILLLVCLVCTAAIARETVTIIDYKDRPATIRGAARSQERVEQAILAATQKLKWTIAEQSAGRLLASQSWNNKHTMLVEIRYNVSSYSVVYHGSTNLNYFAYGKAGPEIHPAYNDRVKALIDSIDAELQRT